MIYARSRNGVIGKDGVMPWHLPEDLAHLKQLTMGSPVIMGRKTWDSLPPRFRPLPGRTNIVITRQADWQAQGAIVAPSLEHAIALCAAEPKAWILGGGQIFAQAVPLADTAEITEIDADYSGDAFAPELGPHWQEVARERHVSATGVHYSFVTLKNTLTGA
jgi:dihydrofolate reductase